MVEGKARKRVVASIGDLKSRRVVTLHVITVTWSQCFSGPQAAEGVSDSESSSTSSCNFCKYSGTDGATKYVVSGQIASFSHLFVRSINICLALFFAGFCQHSVRF